MPAGSARPEEAKGRSAALTADRRGSTAALRAFRGPRICARPEGARAAEGAAASSAAAPALAQPTSGDTLPPPARFKAPVWLPTKPRPPLRPWPFGGSLPHGRLAPLRRWRAAVGLPPLLTRVFLRFGCRGVARPAPIPALAPRRAGCWWLQGWPEHRPQQGDRDGRNLTSVSVWLHVWETTCHSPWVAQGWTVAVWAQQILPWLRSCQSSFLSRFCAKGRESKELSLTITRTSDCTQKRPSSYPCNQCSSCSRACVRCTKACPSLPTPAIASQ